jgi:hypothetical protein
MGVSSLQAFSYSNAMLCSPVDLQVGIQKEDASDCQITELWENVDSEQSTRSEHLLCDHASDCVQAAARFVAVSENEAICNPHSKLFSSNAVKNNL